MAAPSLRLPLFFLLSLTVSCASSTAESAAAPEESVKPGINEPFLDTEVDVEDFVKRFEVESREIYAERVAIAAAVGLTAGMDVADVGAGTGLFEPAFSKSVGSSGTVYAVDLSPGMLTHLTERKQAEGWGNVVVRECTDRSVALPAESVDRVFLCDTYHHFEFPRTTMTSIHHALRDGGEVVIVDFERIEGVTDKWIMGHVRCGKPVVIEELESYGFRLVEEVEIDGMTDNYLLRFVKA